MNKYKQVLSSGLFSTNEEPTFRHHPCDVCNCDGWDSYDVEGYLNLEEAQSDPEGNKYNFKICPKCLYEAHYGEGSYGE